MQLQWDSSALWLLALIALAAIAAWFTRKRWRRWRWTQVMFAVLTNKSLAIRTFLLSLFLQVVLAGGIFTLYYSLYPETRFWHMTLFPLLIQIGLLLPLTVGGIGMREYLSLVFFSDIAGMPADVVLGVSLLGYIPFLLMAFTGGGWMLFRQIGNGATEKQDGT